MTFDASTYHADPMAGLGNPRKYSILSRDTPPPATTITPAVAAKAYIRDLINEPPDTMAGLGGGRRSLENFAARKDGVPKRGETVAIRIGGVRRPVTILTAEELRDGSGFNINGTLPNGDRVEGFVDLETMTLAEESPGDGRNKAAKSRDDGSFTKAFRFKAGDTVRLREHQVVRIATLEKIEPAGKNQVYLQARWPGGGGSGLYDLSQLSPC